MERNPSHLKVGDVLSGTIVKSNGGRRFQVRCAGAPTGWKVELHSRRPESIRPGDNATVWVGKISPLHGEVLVYEGDHGRLPITEAMNGRYLAGLEAVLGEIEATGDNLADASTMLKQVTKQQSADWLTIWRVLGEPASGEVKGLIAIVDKMRAARKESPELLPELQGQARAGFGPMILEAIRRLGSRRT